MATRNDIITGAYQLTGEYSVGETLSAADISVAADFLNELVQELSADGLHLWQRELVSFTPVSGTSTYTIGPTGDVVSTRPLTVHQAFTRSSTSNDTDLVKLSRQEYLILADKTTSGVPNQFYYQPTLVNGTLFLFPTPDTTSITVFLDTHMPIDTFGTASSTQDWPPEWVRFLKYALAKDLGTIFSIPDQQYARIIQGYEVSYRRLLAHDSENASISFKPNAQFRWRKSR